MRSPWRVPRRSAERRAARDMGRCRARQRKRMATSVGVARTRMECAYRRSASLLREEFRSGLAKLGCGSIARTFSYVVIAGLDPAIHAKRRLAEILRSILSVAPQHGPPGQA